MWCNVCGEGFLCEEEDTEREREREREMRACEKCLITRKVSKKENEMRRGGKYGVVVVVWWWGVHKRCAEKISQEKKRDQVM